MPTRPKRFCKQIGCSNLVESGYCDAHRREKVRAYDRKRPEYHEWYNSWRWRQASKAFLRKHPICECDECRMLGEVKPSEVVDHRIPHKGNSVLFWDQSNWQAMAKRCHDKKTATEDGGFGNVERK